MKLVKLIKNMLRNKNLQLSSLSESEELLSGIKVDSLLNKFLAQDDSMFTANTYL